MVFFLRVRIHRPPKTTHTALKIEKIAYTEPSIPKKIDILEEYKPEIRTHKISHRKNISIQDIIHSAKEITNLTDTRRANLFKTLSWSDNNTEKSEREPI